MNAAPRFKILALLIAAAIPCALFAPPVSAQSGWNRSVGAVSVVPIIGDPSHWDVRAVLNVHLEDVSSVPLDLSMEVDLVVNGTVVATNTIPVGANPGGGGCLDGSSCGGSCGSGAVNGMAAALLCVPAGPCNPICDCHCAFPPIQSNFPGRSLQPGDEIMVLLRPAPGALPDPDTSDDLRLVHFADTPILWNREITSVDLTPSSAGPGTWDVAIEGLVLFSGMQDYADPTSGTVPLGFEVELLVNGTSSGLIALPFDPQPSGPCGCGQICGSYNGFPLGCLLGYAGYCSCGWSWLTSMPGVPLDPADEIAVILRPAPGALPELPGFGDDDELDLLCCGATGVRDAVAFPNAGPRLEQNRPNPFDRSTTIAFATASDAPAKLEVFDVRGRRVSTLVDGAVGSADLRQVTWSGRTESGAPAPSGIYFYRLTSGGRTETRKMTLAR